MPKYRLEAYYEEQIHHNERRTLHETLEFERDSDTFALKYAFSPASIDAREEDKKLFRIVEPYGSTIRIHEEE